MCVPAHVYTVNVYYESLQLTSSMHKAQDNGLVDDVNAMHAYGRSSAPIAHELVYDINAPHAFGPRGKKLKTLYAYGCSSAPIAQGLVYDITPLCRHATIDKERRCVTQTTHRTIQEDTVEGGTQEWILAEG